MGIYVGIEGEIVVDQWIPLTLDDLLSKIVF